MMKIIIPVLAVVSMLIPRFDSTVSAAQASRVVNADQPGAKIDRNIYGHFAEHLGRCISEGSPSTWSARITPSATQPSPT